MSEQYHVNFGAAFTACDFMTFGSSYKESNFKLFFPFPKYMAFVSREGGFGMHFFNITRTPASPRLLWSGAGALVHLIYIQVVDFGLLRCLS